MQRRSSPQDISWFLDLRRHSQLDMDPPYQRRSVWNLKDRRFFLDTVFRGYPSPQIFLHKTFGTDQQTEAAGRVGHHLPPGPRTARGPDR
jgi:hypothetical protein